MAGQRHKRGKFPDLRLTNLRLSMCTVELGLTVKIQSPICIYFFFSFLYDLLYHKFFKKSIVVWKTRFELVISRATIWRVRPTALLPPYVRSGVWIFYREITPYTSCAPWLMTSRTFLQTLSDLHGAFFIAFRTTWKGIFINTRGNFCNSLPWVLPSRAVATTNYAATQRVSSALRLELQIGFEPISISYRFLRNSNSTIELLKYIYPRACVSVHSADKDF